MNRGSPIKALIGIALLGLAACTPAHFMREEVAMRLGSAAWMVKREIPAAPFSLTSYERMHERNAHATVYIEGDGKAWSHMSADPTPENPVALHLATKDNAKNVVYLARPCQQSGKKLDDTECEREYWTDRRFAPEVLRAFDAALDNIARQYDITAFHLVGYDGGAVVAAALAQNRKDVLSLRTVAGKLNEIKNPATLAHLPQRHFIGGQDEVTPPGVLHGYLQAVGPSSCVNYDFIQENSHEKGWPDKWPELLALPTSCTAAWKATPSPDFTPYEPGVYTSPEIPEKP
jgi:hypothetical protein